MKQEKRKPGRPKKNKETITVYNQAEIDLEHAQKVITARNETIADLEARLDSAYKEQEEMLIELNRNLHMMRYHCHQVKVDTGELGQEDIVYCANLINRVMEHKFGYKPQTQEL